MEITMRVLGTLVSILGVALAVGWCVDFLKGRRRDLGGKGPMR